MTLNYINLRFVCLLTDTSKVSLTITLTLTLPQPAGLSFNVLNVDRMSTDNICSERWMYDVHTAGQTMTAALLVPMMWYPVSGLGTGNFYFHDKKILEFQDIFQDIRTTYSH